MTTAGSETRLAIDVVVTPTDAAPDRAAPAGVLDEAAARALAARLATQAFAARTDLHHPEGTRVLPTIDPKSFSGGLAGDRWELELAPPAARVSFGRAGERPEVAVSYSDE